MAIRSGSVRIELQQSIWKMDEPLGVDDLLARRSGDVDVIVLDPLTVHPKGKGMEAASFRENIPSPTRRGYRVLWQGFEPKKQKTPRQFSWRFLPE